MPSLIPNINKNFLKHFFSKENNFIKREDNCFLKKYRPISIICITSSYNSPLKVNLGKAKIISFFYAKLVQPISDRSNEGILSFQVDTRNIKAFHDFTSSNEALTEFLISINNIYKNV